MKKLLIILLTIMLVTLTGCQDKVNKKDGSITFTLTDEWKNTITYNGDLPSMSINFDGSLNVYETSSDIGCIFTKNDNFFLSDVLDNHFKNVVKDNYIITEQIEQPNDKPNALFGKLRMPLDEGTISVENKLVSWDETGTRYSYYYRTFTSGEKQYYVYTYNTGITINIEIPLICQKVDGEQKVFMISLPYDTKYQLNINTKIKSLKTKEDYLLKEYHTFEYPSYLNETIDKESAVKEWYEKYCNGRFENDMFIFTYIGIDYYIIFNQDNFEIYVK